MKRPGVISAISGLILLLSVFVTPAGATDMGSSEGYDLDDLWTRAQNTFDLSRQDAIVLLESRHVSFTPEAQVTQVHRVVWIGTGAVVRTYADLRIPYNSASSDFTVLKLRTWRDGRWWPDPEEISPTAVVETLPFAVAQADDYTTMREIMLLHDGVELPCIMETAYEIREHNRAQRLGDGLWVFSQRDPAVLVELKISTSEGSAFVFESANGAPEPVITPESGGKTYAWTMDNVEKLGVPLVADPAAYKPHVVWSTWLDWKTSLGRAIYSSFNEAAEAGDALADTVAQRIENAPSPVAAARVVAEYVKESTRDIHYDTRFWAFAPRPASRTWETAYGHALDRAVLAAALFRDAGLVAEPIYISRGRGAFSTKVPGLSRFEHMMLRVSGKDFDAIYDPEGGTFTEGKRPFWGRVVWKPFDGGSPAAEPEYGTSPSPSRIEVVLNVEPDGEKGWAGSGYLGTGGVFCPYDEMKGLDGESLDYVGRVAASLLSGADVGGCNPDDFSGDRVTVGFRFTAAAGEPDGMGRTRIELGNPVGGITSQLPRDVSLYHESRESPVFLPGVMTQRIRVRIGTGKREVVHLPEPRRLKNDVGSYTLEVTRENGWVTIDETVGLDSAIVSPEAWPQLRALLLEAQDTSGRTVLLK